MFPYVLFKMISVLGLVFAFVCGISATCLVVFFLFILFIRLNEFSFTFSSWVGFFSL